MPLVRPTTSLHRRRQPPQPPLPITDVSATASTGVGDDNADAGWRLWRIGSGYTAGGVEVETTFEQRCLHNDTNSIDDD